MMLSVAFSTRTTLNTTLYACGRNAVNSDRRTRHIPVILLTALTLLERNDMNVSQIAYATGFASPSYFAKMFRAKFKVSPTGYADLKQKNNDVEALTTHGEQI